MRRREEESCRLSVDGLGQAKCNASDDADGGTFGQYVQCTAKCLDTKRFAAMHEIIRVAIISKWDQLAQTARYRLPLHKHG